MFPAPIRVLVNLAHVGIWGVFNGEPAIRTAATGESCDLPVSSHDLFSLAYCAGVSLILPCCRAALKTRILSWRGTLCT
jgi:hypothetical protein